MTNEGGTDSRRPVDRPTAAERAGDPGDPSRHRRVVDASGDQDVAIEDETIRTVKDRWDPASVLAVAAGAALILIGAIALVRTGIDTTWYQPVVQVAGIDHTALLGALEVGVGALLVLAGLAGSHSLAALVALAAGVCAAIAAFEPDLVDRELALERGWAVVLAIGGIALALVLVMAPGRRVEHRIERHHPVAT